jgi:hypothetical protein
VRTLAQASFYRSTPFGSSVLVVRIATPFAVVEALVLALVLAASASAAQSGVVASGAFGVVGWKLSATDSRDGYVCLTMTLPQRLGGRSSECGAIFGPGAGQAHGITYLAHTGAPAPDYIVGPVLATAKTVIIAFSNGKTVRTKTIAPPRGMTAKIAFYVTALRCSALPTSVRGLDTTGRVVAQLAIRRLRPLGKTTC